MASVVSVRVVPDKQLKIRVVDFTCDTAYPTGGYPLAPSALGLEEIWGVSGDGGLAGAGVLATYDNTNAKLKLFATGSANQAALSELAANSTAVNASTVLRLLVFGW